jgi:hypothetical protein
MRKPFIILFPFIAIAIASVLAHIARNWIAAPATAQARTVAPERINVAAERLPEPMRVQVSFNSFFAGPTDESDDAAKLRDRMRRSIYGVAAGECTLIEPVFAKACRLELINLNISPQAGPPEGYMVKGNFVLRDAELRAESMRVQVSFNSFFAGPTDESDDAVKLRDRARRSIYEVAAGECTSIEQVLAKTCRLESINLYFNREAGSPEGYMVNANFVLREAERRADPSRVQVGLNSFFAGPIDESDDAVKLRDRVRRSIHQMAASECTLVEQILAKACRLESINLYLNRQAGPPEGYMANRNFVLRVIGGEQTTHAITLRLRVDDSRVAGLASKGHGRSRFGAALALG